MAKAKKTTTKTEPKVAKAPVKVAKPKAAKAPKKKAAAKPKAAPKVVAKKTVVNNTRISLGTYDTQNIPEESHFYFVNGQKVKNVKELAEIMDRIEQEIFDFHVNPDKNDFYNWVRHVFDDLELAEKMVGVTGPKHLQFTIYKHVADKAMKKK